jgi:large subunit ribosomal protein L17e
VFFTDYEINALYSCGFVFNFPVLIDLNLIVRTGGLRVLLQAMADGPMEFAPYVATAFTYIVDSPKTRVYLHPGTDLEV